MTTKTYIGFALFIGLLGMQAQAAPKAIMQNITTSTDLLSDTFEGVSADSGAYEKNGGDYDPVAVVGTWIVAENLADNAQIQVTSYGTPGALYGDQYLRTIRPVYGDIADQSTVGDALRFEIAINLQYAAEIRLLGDSDGTLAYNDQDFIRLYFTSTLIKYQNNAGVHVDTGFTNYVKNTWGVLSIDYVVGSDEYTIGYNGETKTVTGLAPTIGIPTSVDGFFLYPGADKTAHFDSAGESVPTEILDTTLFLYEGFSYSAGDIHGQSGHDIGFGEAPWAGSSSSLDVAPSNSLESTAFPFLTAGSSIEDANGGLASRILDFNINLADEDDVYYMSFLIQKSTTINSAQELVEMRFDDGQSTSLNFGITSTDSFFAQIPPSSASLWGTVSPSTTYFIVAKLITHSGNTEDEVSVFVYAPTDTVPTEEPLSASFTATGVSSTAINRLVLNSQGNTTGGIDEIRIGSTWRNVAVVPPVSSYASQWPSPIDPYPVGTVINKPFYTTVDIGDDLWRAGSTLTDENIQNLMTKFSQLGITRVYWQLHPGFDRTGQALRADKDGLAALSNIVTAAHSNGLEFFATLKVFETGYMYVPQVVPLPPELDKLEVAAGYCVNMNPFLFDHPEYMFKRRPESSFEDEAIKTIKIVKNNSETTSLQGSDLTLLTSQMNGNFSAFSGTISTSNTVEDRNGKNVRVLTLSLSPALDATNKYIMVKTSNTNSDFANVSSQLIELYDEDNHQIPLTWDEGIYPKVQVMDTVRNFWLRRNGTKAIPAEYAFPSNYGSSLETSGFYFNKYDVDRTRTLNSNDAIEGHMAVYRDKQQYLPSPHPCYPQVRDYWLTQMSNAINAGVDGIDIRVDCHSTYTSEPNEYGFNDPIVSAYSNQYNGTNILTEAFDTELWRELQGDSYTLFVDAAATLAAQNNIKMQVHVNALMGVEIPYWYLNNTVTTIEWQWERWINEGMTDIIALKYIPWPFFGTPMGLGDSFAREVVDLARTNNTEILYIWRLGAFQLISSGSLLPIHLDGLLMRLNWALPSQAIDGLIIYEGFDYTIMDPVGGGTYVSPAFEDILKAVKTGIPDQLLWHEDLEKKVTVQFDPAPGGGLIFILK